MKKILIAAVIAGVLPSFAGAQDTLATGREIRLGGFIISGEHNSSFNNVVKTTTGNVKGVELLLRYRRFGIQIRSSSSAFGNPPDVINADIAALIGPPRITGFVGASKRAVTSTLGTNVYTFARLGAQTTINIGVTGLRAQIGGWLYLPADQAMRTSGEAETSILYSPASLPIFIQFGYRNEIFKAQSSSGATPEEVRGLRLGGGIQLGGK
jgi:hypothetical protein